MENIDVVEKQKQRKLFLLWALTFLILFPTFVTFGLVMRMNHSEMIHLQDNTFYEYMTMHGLGMAGILFSVAFGGLWYLLSTRYLNLNRKVGYFVYFAFMIGIVGLMLSVFVGRYAAGWYLLYPLPFFSRGAWTEWSIIVNTVSLIIQGIGWMVGVLHVIYRMARKYQGFGNMLGWQYLSKKKENRVETPVLVMIAGIALIPQILAVIAAAVFLIMYTMQYFEPTLDFDALAMKNMIMFFGHTIANITMYCCVGWVYHLFPEFTKREIHMNRVLVLSWNATFFFIVFAFFHHMYMDFGQPVSLQVFAQIISYSSAVPATAITMFTMLGQLYHSQIRWSAIPLMFFVGMAGWATGGVGALVDTTISVNKVMHNTLWVPAHFHTYMLLGVVLFIFGFLFYTFSEGKGKEIFGLARFGFWTFVLGAATFVCMFYVGGYNSVPRRYSNYSGANVETMHHAGVESASIAVVGISIVLLGLVLMYIALFKQLNKKVQIAD